MSSFVISARSTATTSTASMPTQFKIVGVLLAGISGILIGSSFVFKKKGLLSSQGTAGEGVAYLKSPMWWTGMTMMILGELCNFGSYAFIPAVIVTPLGALSVVICAILSSIFLKETLTFFGWIGCFLCIVGSVIIALNGPQEQSASTIPEFQHLFLSVGFIIFGSVVVLSALVIIFFVAPKHGKENMLWYILICSLFGGLSVSCTQGLGSSIVTTIRGNNQFKHWFMYFLIGFVAVTLVTEIYFLNRALALFNTAMVTPTYYVIFTFFTLVTSVVLYQGLDATVVQILTVVLAFFVICAGITILQMSKVDPTSLGNLDRKSTLLLQASRQNVEKRADDLSALEDPGMDALRGSFGAFGSIIRAKSVSRMSTADSVLNRRRVSDLEAGRPPPRTRSSGAASVDDLPRLQLYDSPMPPSTSSVYQSEGDHPLEVRATTTTPVPQRTRIKFKDGYQSPGKPGPTIHEEQPARGLSPSGRRGLLDPISEHDKRSTVHLEADESPPLPHERFRTPPPSSSSRSPLGLRQDNDIFSTKHRGNTVPSEVALIPSIPFSVSNMNPAAGQSQDDLLLAERVTHPEGHTSESPLTPSPLTPSRSIHRSYPGDRGRTNSEDEIEAHESLVSHLTDDEDSVDVERTPTRNHGGIRLVQSRKSTPRRL